MDFSTFPTILQTTSAVTSTSLLALSAVTIYLATDYTTALDSRVPGGPHTWFGLIGSPERSAYWVAVDSGSKNFDRVTLEYINSNDIWVLMSGCVGLAAGLMAWLAVWWTSRKEKNPTVRRSGFPWILVSSIFFSTAALAMSLTSIIFTSQTKTRLQGSTCIPHSVYTPKNNHFVCTRELAACNLLENLYMEDMEWSDKMCKEARVSRTMLIPTLACTVLLVVVWIAQIVVGKKRATAVADTRVARLLQEEKWEKSTAYEPMRCETREKV